MRGVQVPVHVQMGSSEKATTFAVGSASPGSVLLGVGTFEGTVDLLALGYDLTASMSFGAAGSFGGAVVGLCWLFASKKAWAPGNSRPGGVNALGTWGDGRPSFTTRQPGEEHALETI